MPFISNRSLNLAVLIDEGSEGSKLARVKIPTVLPRLVPVGRRGHTFVLLEDVIRQHLYDLFPDVPLAGAFRFRVVRDADVEIRELEAGDLIDKIEETIRRRRFGDPVRLDVDQDTPDDVRDRLTRILEVDARNVYRVAGLLGFDVLDELANLPVSALRWPPHKPHAAEALGHSEELFQTLRTGDVLVHQPFDSFHSVETMVSAAVSDPAVIGIKQTLYRVGEHSPIVEALLEAAEAGKQVAVMVELKARFDESKNLVWARALERAGAHVTYGFTELKVHAKLCLVVRREAGGLRTYAHIGTGNYNPMTARLYTDLGLFTSDPEITQDLLELFNFLTGVSRQRSYRKLLVAPVNLRSELLRRLRRERDHARTGRPARIIFKLNSLTDPDLIEALYELAGAGAQVDLLVRGICCMRLGVAGPRRERPHRLRGRPVPRAQPHLLVRERRRARSVDRQRRRHGPEPRPPHRDAGAADEPGTGAPSLRRDSASVPRGLGERVGDAARRLVRPAGTGTRRGAVLGASLVVVAPEHGDPWMRETR